MLRTESNIYEDLSGRVVNLGTGLVTPSDFRLAFKKKDCHITHNSDKILHKIVVSEPTTVELVDVSAAELGCNDDAFCHEIYQRAQERGFELCPHEVGPQVLLQYGKELVGWRLIAMEPIIDSRGRFYLFYIGRRGGAPYMGVRYGYPMYFYEGNRRWLFARRNCSK